MNTTDSELEYELLLVMTKIMNRHSDGKTAIRAATIAIEYTHKEMKSSEPFEFEPDAPVLH